ncbi:sulfatase [Nocardioides sp. HDW12B]|uniref:sulfatase family protein n=1 Tax=Nocardioides sp. HDW12B TaxID=2714939 RepID=UPI00140D8B29|nr:sulfatase [Nocardioides sp. HDW12B]QIK66650.1 sulfatase [Nocardioides sp. HDW12B]
MTSPTWSRPGRPPAIRAALLPAALLALLLALLVGVAPSPAPAARAAAAPAPASAPARPNIVLLMVDDMRADDLRFMPRTRRLIGGEGVTFSRSFSPNPLCCPARASALTGRYTHNHRVFHVYAPWGFRSFDDRSTVATWLQHAGYATIHLGKYLNGYGFMREPGATSGSSVHYVPPGWTQWRASLDGGLPPGHPARGSTYEFFDTTLSRNGEGFQPLEGQYQTRAYGRIAREIVTRRAAGARPFYLQVAFTAPHNGGPIEPDDPGDVKRSDGKLEHFGTTARPDDVKGRFDRTLTAAPGASWHDPDFSDKPAYLAVRPPLNDAERAAMLEETRQRAEALWVVDQQVERTIETLRATGELDRTLVVFTSDNGFYLGEQRFRHGKVFPHEPSIRVPLLMRGPGIPAGAIRRDPVMSMDLAPTFAAAAGVVPPATVDGQSVLSVARNGDVGWQRGVLTESRPEGSIVRDTDEAGRPLGGGGTADIRYAIGVRTAHFLYVDLATGEEELYDLRTDPEQYVNLAGRPEYAATQALLREVLSRLRACDGAECRQPLPPELAGG